MRDTAVLRHYLAPLLPLLEPEDVTELVVNRPGEAGIEDRQGWRWQEMPELDSDWLSTLAVAAASFTHQDIDGQSPICSTVLPGGERCRSEEHTSELQSLMRISYDVFCLKKKTNPSQ